MIVPVALTLAMLSSAAASTPITPASTGPDAVEPAATPRAFAPYLERAIERGVPLFNQGQPAACAAVYATALEAIVQREGGGIGAQQRSNLEDALELAAVLEDASERAWAYRGLIDARLSGEPISTPGTAQARTLFDFSDLSDVRRWGVVLDGVMGGLSSGRIEQNREAHGCLG